MLRMKRVALMVRKALLCALAGTAAGLLVAILNASLWGAAQARCLSLQEARAGGDGYPRYRVIEGQRCWYRSVRGESRARSAWRESVRVPAEPRRKTAERPAPARSPSAPTAIAEDLELAAREVAPETPAPAAGKAHTAELTSPTAAEAAPVKLESAQLRLDETFSELAASWPVAPEQAAQDAAGRAWPVAWLSWIAAIGLVGSFVCFAANPRRSVAQYVSCSRLARMLASSRRRSSAAARVAAAGLTRRTFASDGPIYRDEILRLLGRGPGLR